MHNLMGLCKEGILHEDEVSAFRAHLLETLIASPLDYEPPLILRDKLIFLQVAQLCISSFMLFILSNENGLFCLKYINFHRVLGFITF